MKFLGLNMSKAYVRSPECNGVIERFHLTLEEELLQIKSFNSLEEAQREIADFVEKYNTHWILHRLDHYSPLEYKRRYVEELKNAQARTSGNIEPAAQFVLLLSGSIPRKKDQINKGANLSE